ncbi:MAG TPA: class III poly(R)-hydroxyalkanoic acid synthase subunit PhaC [Candidatus Competibacteraceae bacterium]|nr:MAG: class III poly(R)-hydroxyalkanoic acid synthase subunit PhaC [Candidatus Competibacteraceae bacterium]HOB61525.1 class III poly(R)-hydroxyalkanoic acid synthase subunit PhaC [Candidatus Competibacteraceae bacterium]HQA25014.1 class III poly(R)-hydroxyalkanoic acid synthase subunit PhaC [Candidatus Competibacteraceae bacterium]HQD55967.1 class III poly(R)-hydroxyalkanoic acid synthase subunit PhaC [Candidatus Competibacteraceae bacterium]
MIQFSPEQITEELQEFAARLAQGAKMLGEVGEIEAGVSPRDPVYQEDKLTLYRYRPRVAQPHPVPLLIVYALVNRPYMMDLQEDRSLIRGLLDAGLDVYLIDWGYADAEDRWLTLGDYVHRYIGHCVDVLRERCAQDTINLLGVCQGGALSLCFAALYPAKIRNLITMVTPVDFHTPDNLLTHLIRHVEVDALVDTFGNLPGQMLNFTFLSLSPFRLTGQKYVDVVDILDDVQALKNFLRMEKWIFDSPDQAGEAFRQFAKEFFQQNKLVRGEVMIGEQRVELRNITMPVLNVYATQDHLVPPAASKALAEHCGSRDYSEFSFKGGHIGIYVSSRAQREVPPTIASWLLER